VNPVPAGGARITTTLWEAEDAMRTNVRLRLAAISILMAATATAQDASPLDFDDLVGVWSMVYEDGQVGTLTLSKQRDGMPKIMVTTAFGESEARDVVIEDNAITSNREIVDPLGQTIRIEYTAKLVDGKLEGTGATIGLPGDLDGTTPFTATRRD
jgi:hypothetical protein